MASMARLALLLTLALGAASTTSPLAKVVELLGGMEEKTRKQGEEADGAFEEADKFCRRRSDELGYSIKTFTSQKDDLEAKVAKSTSSIESTSSSLQDTSQEIDTNEAQLTKATEVREKERADFAASEKNLLDTMDSMTRAMSVLEKEAAKKNNPSESLLQVQQAPDIVAALEAMVSGSLISAADRDGLTNFLQGSESQAPSVPAYKPRSGGVIDMLESLQDKAKSELYELRKKENQSRSNYQLLRQSLQDEIKFAKDEVKKLKAKKAEESSNKASDEKDLKEATTNLAEDSKALQEFTAECRRKKQDYELQTKERSEELKALATAKEALVKKTGGAAAQTYSFLQSHGGQYPSKTVVQLLRDAALKSESSAISLLAKQVSNLMAEQPAAAAGVDVFAKIKTMITNMISNMQKSLADDTDHHEQCKKEMKESKEKLASKTAEVSQYQNKIDQAVSKSAMLKEEVAELKHALSMIAEAQANATKIRNKELMLFKKNEPEIEQGLEGVKIALKILRDYYGQADQGAATGIIGMLEVVDSDFAKNLAEMRVAESTAAEDFKKDEQEMKLEKTRKEQDVKYKEEAHQQLDAEVAEVQGDANSAQSVLEDEKKYAETVRAKCIVTPESFEEKRAKRQQEIDDLKGALAALESSDSSASSLVQKHEVSAVRQLRGSHAAHTMGN